VKLLGLGIALLTLTGAAEESRPRPVIFSMWAVQATREGRAEKHFDRGIEAVRAAVADLGYDTYRKVKTVRQSAAFKKDTRIRIDAHYTLVMTPLENEGEGRVQIDLRVEMDPKRMGGKPVKALATRLVMNRGKMVKLGGLKLKKGELVVVLKYEG